MYCYAYVDDQDDVAEKLPDTIYWRYQSLIVSIGYWNDHDDAMDVASEEANEDFLKSAVEASAPLNLKQTPLFQLYKNVFLAGHSGFGSLLSGLNCTFRINY